MRRYCLRSSRLKNQNKKGATKWPSVRHAECRFRSLRDRLTKKRRQPRLNSRARHIISVRRIARWPLKRILNSSSIRPNPPLKSMSICTNPRAGRPCTSGRSAYNSLMKTSAVSQHLRKLKDKSILRSRREKQTIYYSLVPNVFTSNLRDIFEGEETKEPHSFMYKEATQ